MTPPPSQTDGLHLAHSMVETVREPLVVLRGDLRVLRANRAFYDTFHVQPEQTVGRYIDDLGDGQWHIPRLRLLLEEILPRDTELRDFEVSHTFPTLGTRTMLLNARRVMPEVEGEPLILLAIEDVTARREVERALHQLNEELEQRVAERTAELAATNRELEAFSYSVSHDLRAPLRAIDGFTRILIEEHRDELSPEAQRYLDLVRRNTQQMGRLIDDLLAFSRLGRQGVQAEPVDPADAARQAWELLHAERAGRTIDLRLGELPTCLADPSLLTQVFLNLLSNAVKFTRPRDPAVIEVGHRADPQQSGHEILYVRDNGVGFDPRYVHKLFSVFQRLHRAEEYEGTGVGLAIVQRIVHRHGGRVWIEGDLDRGATVSFTLPRTTPATAPASESNL